MKRFGRALFVILAVMMVSGTVAFAQAAAPQSGPSDLLDVYKQATNNFASTAYAYANTLFGLLAVIDFAWAMIVLFMEGHELQGWVAGMLKKLLTIGFFYAVLLNQSTWFPAIVNSFVQIGQRAGGISGYLNPSDILYTGLKIGGSLLAATVPNAAVGAVVGTIVPGAGIVGLIPSLLALFCAIVIVLSYVVITFTFIMATVESYIVMSMGIIFLGFGASRWTVPYAERYFSAVVSTGVRLMVIYLIVGLGNTMNATWIQQAQNLPLSVAGVQSLLGLLATVLIYMALAWQAPKLAASLLSGSLQMGSSDLIAPAVTATVAAATVGAVAATGGAALAGGIGALAGAGGGSAGAGGSFAAAGSGGGLLSGGGMGAGNGAAAMSGVEGAMHSVAPPAVSGSVAGTAGAGPVAVAPPAVEGGSSGAVSAPSGGSQQTSATGAGSGAPNSTTAPEGGSTYRGSSTAAGTEASTVDAGSSPSDASSVASGDAGEGPTVQTAGKAAGGRRVQGAANKSAAAEDAAVVPAVSEAISSVEGVGNVAGVVEEGASVAQASVSPSEGASSVAQGAGDSPAVSAPSSVETAGGSDASSGVVPAPQTTSSSSSNVPQGRNRREVMDMLSRGAISPAEAEAQLADLESSAEKRGLGDRVSAAHNAGATVRQHLPEDSASVSAPTLNIHHGE